MFEPCRRIALGLTLGCVLAAPIRGQEKAIDCRKLILARSPTQFPSEPKAEPKAKIKAKKGKVQKAVVNIEVSEGGDVIAAAVVRPTSGDLVDKAVSEAK